MSVVDTLEVFLRDNKEVAMDPLAAAAMRLAVEMDGAPATLAACASAFQKMMAELRRLAPAKTSGGTVDDLQKRRAEKLRATGT